ncbi:MAG: DUF4446 family protein [Lachnospiraceae bacterium]|nr:DUF4446 family protein [Lachnospiraceae bacterium]
MNEYILLINSIESFWLWVAVAALLLLVLIMIIVLAFTGRRLKTVEKKLKSFTSGGDGTSLEKEIRQVVSDNKNFREELGNHDRRLNELHDGLEGAVQKVSLVKYDAFKEMGGRLSSAVALLDGKNNGLLIDVVHSTSGSYTYTKKIKDGLCDIDLGKEEQEALTKAMEKTIERSGEASGEKSAEKTGEKSEQ